MNIATTCEVCAQPKRATTRTTCKKCDALIAAFESLSQAAPERIELVIRGSLGTTAGAVAIAMRKLGALSARFEYDSFRERGMTVTTPDGKTARLKIERHDQSALGGVSPRTRRLKE